MAAINVRRFVPELKMRVSHVISSRPIVAAHYFGQAWPANFWSSHLTAATVRDDFRTLKAAGFNSVVLVVPWGQFQRPAIQAATVDWDQRHLDKLEMIMETAGREELGVALRVGYSHDLLFSQESLGWQLYTSDVARRLWVDFIGRIYRLARQHANFRLAFITWEDLSQPLFAGDLPIAERRRIATASGFDLWLAGRKSAADPGGPGSPGDGPSDLVVPGRRDPAFEEWLAYWDFFLVEKLLRPAQSTCPGLSMEVRVDDDPIFDRDAVLHWYSHARTYDLPGTSWVVTYLAPFMGAENAGESVSPEDTIDRMARMLEKVGDAAPGKMIFVDQFNFVDNTPGLGHNARIPQADLPAFLSLAPDLLLPRTGGYGLWSFRDYDANLLVNPTFALGLDEWMADGTVVTETASDRSWARIGAGATLCQTIPKFRRDVATHGLTSGYRFCFDVRNASPADLVISWREGADTHVALAAAERWSPVCVPLTGVPERLGILVQGSAVELSRLLVYAHTQSLMLLSSRANTVLDRPLWDGVMALNWRVGVARWPRSYDMDDAAALGAFSDGWMGHSTSDIVLACKEDDSAVVVETYLPEDWPVEPTLMVVGPIGRCSLVGRRGASVHTIPLQELTSDAGHAGVLCLRIQAEQTVVPARSGLGRDERSLGCVLCRIAVE